MKRNFQNLLEITESQFRFDIIYRQQRLNVLPNKYHNRPFEYSLVQRVPDGLIWQKIGGYQSRRFLHLSFLQFRFGKISEDDYPLMG